MNTVVFVLVTFLHNLFTAIWIGGLMVAALSFLPALKETLDEAPKIQRVMTAFQRRQSLWVYISIVGLIVTGVLMTNRSQSSTGSSRSATDTRWRFRSSMSWCSSWSPSPCSERSVSRALDLLPQKGTCEPPALAGQCLAGSVGALDDRNRDIIRQTAGRRLILGDSRGETRLGWPARIELRISTQPHP